jgi:hypothetical protein
VQQHQHFWHGIALIGEGAFQHARSNTVLHNGVWCALLTQVGTLLMQVLINTLLHATRPLLDVIVLCSFVFFIFGIIGVQVFSGALQNRCDIGAAPCQN